MPGKHQLPDLPYPEDALSPHISAETLSLHHGKHHATYVDKLNGLIEGTDFADKGLNDIIVEADGGILNNGAQAWNHAFYWHCLSPDGGGNPQGELATRIQRDFGTTDVLREQFSQALTTLFGSGGLARAGPQRQARYREPQQRRQPAARRHAADPDLRHVGARLLRGLPQSQAGIRRRLTGIW